MSTDHDLARILARIPNSHPAWISMGDGWLPIVIDLDARLATLDADYRLLEAKQKFALLRYRTQTTLHGPPLDAFRSAIVDAELRCETTCEECGAAGTRCATHYEWYEVLCPDCAVRLGSSPVPAQDRWILET